MKPLVVLIGPPGVGKTTVGHLLADALGVEVRDTDHDVEATAGMPVSDIFVTRSEAEFRALEVEAVAAALAEHEGVLALGGGAVVNPETRRALADHLVVFLDVSLTQAVRRVGMNASRPLLLGNVRGQLKQLMDGRRPIYAEVATLVVDTSDLTAQQVSDQILTLLESR